MVSEYFSPELIDSIINANRHIVTQRNESFGYDTDRLNDVFTSVNSITKNDFPDNKERIIMKASHLLGGITYQQPFNNGNKTTATTATIEFLRKNGYDLPITTEEGEEELIALLEKTLYKFENDPTIITEVERYLRRKIVP